MGGLTLAMGDATLKPSLSKSHELPSPRIHAGQSLMGEAEIKAVGATAGAVASDILGADEWHPRLELNPC